LPSGFSLVFAVNRQLDESNVRFPMKFKRFETSTGMEILVGQDDRSNDALTFRTGHPEDIWLHVNGAPGSHVLLRCGSANREPDRASLKEAAALAAWFSKLRSGGTGSVHFCRLKHVGKPRGAKSGSVVLKRARSISVRPRLPAAD
jgi:predicted ribosome quality control (RQC) complex YloA/Tae2 family protein